MTTQTANRFSIVRSDFFYVWLGLTGVTCLSFRLGSDHSASAAMTANIVVIAVALLKVRLIGSYFMDLKDAPRLLRTGFDIYCVGLGVALIALLAI